MKPFTRLLSAIILLTAMFPFANTAGAQLFSTRPSLEGGAQFMNPVDVWALYYGKTQKWGAGSFGYWAPDRTFRAVNEYDKSIGVGEWYVTDSHKMCYSATWYWLENFETAKKNSTTCYQFAITNDKRIWHRRTSANRNQSWLPFDTSNFVAGDVSNETFRLVASELGLIDLSN